MARVSVVIPIYNTKDYLARCVNSVLNQTFSEISVILVDDGSTDGSAAICDQIAKQDNRVQVIHKANGGLSSARNAGLGAADGEYVYFVDSDDYLHPAAIERLISAATCDTDVVVCGYYLDYGTHIKENFVQSGIYTLSNIGVAFPKLKAKHIFDPVWNKLIKLKILKENSLLFKEGELYEDTEFNIKLLKCNPNIRVISDCLYYYVQRAGSITKRFNSSKLSTLKKRALDLIELSLMFNSEPAFSYCNYIYIKYIFSSFIDYSYKYDGLKIKALIKAEITDPAFSKILKQARGISLAEKGVLLVAKTKSVFLIKLFCKILFKAR